MERFDIPVTLFFFKRQDSTLRVLDRIAQIKPKKLYLISDGPRNETENEIIEKCRSVVEARIDWECEVIKNYADTNRGVYDRIGLGAIWVLSIEESSIFLEDDNLPEVTFFYYCKELLEKYKHDTRVFWICGTNYLQEYEPLDGTSYVFTKHLMPCGWASWASKFNQFYDGEMEFLNDKKLIKRIKYEYEEKRLYKQQLNSILSEFNKKKYEGKPASWDFQMAMSIRMNNLYGISPKFNQIENIGVDLFSTHGGTTFDNIMTKRFCGIKSYPLEFPLKHPEHLIKDHIYEKKVSLIILYPLSMRCKFAIKGLISKIIKYIFKINPNESVTKVIKRKLRK